MNNVIIFSALSCVLKCWLVSFLTFSMSMFRKILESLKMKVKFNQEIIFVSEIPSYSAFKKEEKKINLSWFCSCLVFWLIIRHQSKSKLLIFSVGKADFSTKHFNNKLKLKCVKRENMLKYVHCCCCLADKLCPTLLPPCGLQPASFLCLGFSRQEHWSGLPFPPPGDLPDSGIEPRTPAWQADSLPLSYLVEGNP